MTYKQIDDILDSIGIPYAYNQFDNDSPQELPFICFLYDDSNDLAADNVNYSKIRQLSIELYTENKDFTLESTVEDTLSENGFVYSRSETYLESERMFMVVYETEIVITEEQ